MTAPWLISCVGVAFDLDLLPHFLRHYLRLGVLPDSVRLMLNAPDRDAPGLAGAGAVLDRFGVPPAEIWVGPYTSDAMWERRRAMQRRIARPDDWVLSADVDEFHEYPEPLAAFLKRCERVGVTCAQGPMIDRLAPGGRLAAVADEPSLEEQFPIEADVIWSVGGQGQHHDRYGTVKMMAMRGDVLPSRGGHHPLAGQSVQYLYGAPLAQFRRIVRPGFRLGLPLRVHHFHWTEAMPESLRRRLATPGVSPAGREYCGKMLAHIEAHGGVDLRQTGRAAPGPEARLPWPVRLALLRAEGQGLRLARGARGRLRALRP